MNRKLKVIFCLFFILINFTYFTCDNPVEEKESTLKYLLSTMDSDGSNFKKLTDWYHGSPHYFIKNDSSLISKWNNKFVIMNLDSLNEKYIETDLHIRDFVLSHDKAKIAILDYADNDIYVLDIATEIIYNVTNSPNVKKYYPSFSHNNQNIIFYNDINKSLDIVDINNMAIQTVIKDSSDLNICSGRTESFLLPCFGKNDLNIFYVYLYKDTIENICVSQLCSIDVNGNNKTIIDSSMFGLYDVETSFDGSKILYIDTYPYTINVISSDGLEKFNLGEIPEGYSLSGVELSNDGSKVLVSKNRDGYNIYTIEVNTNEVKKIFTRGMNASFSSDDSKIIFLSTEDY